MTRILVAGATGRLGMRLVRRLKADGHRIRIAVREAGRVGLLARHVDEVVRADLTAAELPEQLCRDVDVVVSCASASTSLFDVADAASFDRVNHDGNARLLAAAERARVRRFMYIAPLGSERLAHTVYGAAHERFIARLRQTDVDAIVVRATGYFSYFAEALRLLHGGVRWPFGDGPWRTNPIHETDLAEFCALALLFSSTREVAVGGPQVLTRAEIRQLAERAITQVRTNVVGDYTATVRADENPRRRALLEFAAAVSRIHVVGTAYGTLTLEDHFTALAAAWPAHPPPGIRASRSVA